MTDQPRTEDAVGPDTGAIPAFRPGLPAMGAHVPFQWDSVNPTVQRIDYGGQPAVFFALSSASATMGTFWSPEDAQKLAEAIMACAKAPSGLAIAPAHALDALPPPPQQSV